MCVCVFVFVCVCVCVRVRVCVSELKGCEEILQNSCYINVYVIKTPHLHCACAQATLLSTSALEYCRAESETLYIIVI